MTSARSSARCPSSTKRSSAIAKGDRADGRATDRPDDAAQIGEIRPYRKDGRSWILIPDFARVVDATEEERGYATYQDATSSSKIAEPEQQHRLAERGRFRKEPDKIKEFLPEGSPSSSRTTIQTSSRNPSGTLHEHGAGDFRPVLFQSPAEHLRHAGGRDHDADGRHDVHPDVRPQYHDEQTAQIKI